LHTACVQKPLAAVAQRKGNLHKHQMTAARNGAVIFSCVFRLFLINEQMAFHPQRGRPSAHSKDWLSFVKTHNNASPFAPKC
jgi:hypothetical protein